MLFSDAFLLSFSAVTDFLFLPNRRQVKCLQGASQVVLVVKNLFAEAGHITDASLTPGSGRAPGGGHGNPLQYSCLENPTHRAAGGLQSIGS